MFFWKTRSTAACCLFPAKNSLPPQKKNKKRPTPHMTNPSPKKKDLFSKRQVPADKLARIPLVLSQELASSSLGSWPNPTRWWQFSARTTSYCGWTKSISHHLRDPGRMISRQIPTKNSFQVVRHGVRPSTVSPISNSEHSHVQTQIWTPWLVGIYRGIKSFQFFFEVVT